MLQKLVWLSAAGATGTVARVGLSTWVQRWNRTDTPLGTAIVNVFGCFLFGLCFSAFEGRLAELMPFRLIVLAGFLGGFTTFSSYMFETVRLVEQGRVGLAMLNLLLQNAFGIAALWLGLGLGRGS